VAAAGVAGNGDRDGNWDGDEEEEELEYTGYEGVTVLRADITGPPDSQRWALPFPSSSQSQSSSSSSSATAVAGGLRENQFSLKFDAPEHLELAVIQCIFTKRMEDVKKKSSKQARVTVAIIL
jgi:hypothetical protein